jgi:WD40 repeat protein
MAESLELNPIPARFPAAINTQTKSVAVNSPGSCLSHKHSEILICNIDNPEKISRYDSGLISGDRIALSRNGEWLAAGKFTTEHSLNGFLLSLQIGKKYRFYQGNVNILSPIKPCGSHCVSFHPSDRILAVAASLGTLVSLLDVQSIIDGKPIILKQLTEKLNHFECEALAWSYDGNFLAQQGTYINPGIVQKWLKRCILIWQISNDNKVFTAKHVTTLGYSGDGLTTDHHPIGLAFDSSGDVLAVGGDGRADTIKLFALKGPKHLFTTAHLGSGICWLDFIENTEYLASGSMDGVFRLWRMVFENEAVSLILFKEVQCGGQIAGAVTRDSGKTIVVVHAVGKKQIGFLTIYDAFHDA